MQEQLEKHYADLKNKPFFPSLIKYMLSGPVVCMVWEGLNAFKVGRAILGAVSCLPVQSRKHPDSLQTNPQDSAPGTIRGDFCMVTGANVCKWLAPSCSPHPLTALLETRPNLTVQATVPTETTALLRRSPSGSRTSTDLSRSKVAS